jgi:MtN3 and saliva related transmembrane protein
MQYNAWIGWGSSAILLATLIRQVYSQWKSRESRGVSRWLFIGQVAASVGFTIYSLLLHNWVYVTSNVAILITAIAGEAIYLRNTQHAQRHGNGAGRGR